MFLQRQRWHCQVAVHQGYHVPWILRGLLLHRVVLLSFAVVTFVLVEMPLAYIFLVQ